MREAFPTYVIFGLCLMQVISLWCSWLGHTSCSNNSFHNPLLASLFPFWLAQRLCGLHLLYSDVSCAPFCHNSKQDRFLWSRKYFLKRPTCGDTLLKVHLSSQRISLLRVREPVFDRNAAVHIFVYNPGTSFYLSEFSVSLGEREYYHSGVLSSLVIISATKAAIVFVFSNI